MKGTSTTVDVGELYVFAQETIQKMGVEALKFYGKGRHRPPFDQDLVTQAELHLNSSFQNIINARFPNHQIYGQAPLDEGYTHGGKRYLWVFDPLDGVDNFQSGIPIWGMSLALYENYWPVLGLFLMPVTNDLFRACAGEKAYWNDRVIEIGDRGGVSRESLLLTFSRFHQSYECRFPGKIRDFGSTGAHVCYVAMGRADAAFTANESFKDLAAVGVIVEAAGGRLMKIDGQKFLLGDYIEGQRIDGHLMVTGKSIARALLDCIRPNQK
ncbi:MAG: inositol monophosphatase family protein [Desulfobacteraceae bacterium]